MFKRMLGVLLLVLGLGWTVAVAAQTKAYAPEDLSSLAVPDRIRVIEKEFAEQSGGRRIPDDQLEFYLDQIDSGWRWSQIKSDISASIGGGSGGWHPGPGEPGIAPEVRCESRDARYIECPTQFRGAAMMARQLSSIRCTEGVNFGSRPGLVWVSQGCRATFVEDTRYSPPAELGRELRCESRNGQYQECRTSFRGSAVLARQTSSTACIEGRTWGNRSGVVWVNGGCRGRFVEQRGDTGGYTVDCNSSDGRYQTCRWDSGAGRPYLVEQMSQTACIEGRTWGYDRRAGLWVDRGCRGRFSGAGY